MGHTIIWPSFRTLPAFTPYQTFLRAVHSKYFPVCQASDSGQSVGLDEVRLFLLACLLSDSIHPCLFLKDSLEKVKRWMRT